MSLPERAARLDWGLYVAGLALSSIGAVLVWSATRHTAGEAMLARQGLFTLLGFSVSVGVVRLSLERLRLLALPVYAAAVLGLIAVLTPAGSTVNGSRSWIVLPAGFSIQPSEVSKVALVVALAWVLSQPWQRGRRPGSRQALTLLLLAGVPVGLILLQPDLGSALVLVTMAFAMAFVGGVSWRWLIGGIFAGAILAVVAWQTLLSSYQRDRLTAFLHPDADPLGIGYQTRQVRIAVGGGGVWGQGLFHGSQTQSGAIPFQETDFIFSVAAEELGFVGSAVLLTLLGLIVVRAMVIAARSRSAFGRVLATGVAVWFMVQVFENVGMNLQLMPVTGLPLPLLSYGGSSMVACWLGLALLQVANRETTAR